VSVHGANRLGGNSLLETVVFGRLVAEAINAREEDFQREPSEKAVEEQLRRQVEQVEALLARRGGVPHRETRERLRTVLMEKVGIFRNAGDLADAVGQIRELRDQYRSVGCQTPLGPFNYEIIHLLELESSLYLGEITARGALAREESRGSQFRTDYPKRNDVDWLKHTIARLEGGEVVLSYADVDVSIWEPKERTY
jgi:succinate dehydrogenase / fumarate reductase flavoprotein subunit